MWPVTLEESQRMQTWRCCVGTEGIRAAPTCTAPTSCSHFFTCAGAAAWHHSRPPSGASCPTLSIFIHFLSVLLPLQSKVVFSALHSKTAFRHPQVSPGAKRMNKPWHTLQRTAAWYLHILCPTPGSALEAWVLKCSEGQAQRLSSTCACFQKAKCWLQVPSAPRGTPSDAHSSWTGCWWELGLPWGHTSPSVSGAARWKGAASRGCTACRNWAVYHREKNPEVVKVWFSVSVGHSRKVKWGQRHSQNSQASKTVTW